MAYKDKHIVNFRRVIEQEANSVELMQEVYKQIPKVGDKIDGFTVKKVSHIFGETIIELG